MTFILGETIIGELWAYDLFSLKKREDKLDIFY